MFNAVTGFYLCCIKKNNTSQETAFVHVIASPLDVITGIALVIITFCCASFIGMHLPLQISLYAIGGSFAIIGTAYLLALLTSFILTTQKKPIPCFLPKAWG